jgi:hypothetical protein
MTAEAIGMAGKVLLYLGSWRRTPTRRWWCGWPGGPCSPRHPSGPCHPTRSPVEQRPSLPCPSRDRWSKQPRLGRWSRGDGEARARDGGAIREVVGGGEARDRRGAMLPPSWCGCQRCLPGPAFIGERRWILASGFGLARDPREILLLQTPTAFAKPRKLLGQVEPIRH